MHCLSIVFFIFVHFHIEVFSEPNGYKLELVQMLFRHGDRTIQKKEMYPNDPYNLTVYEPYGIGELTNKGKLRMYHLGQVLRRHYADFLGTDYKSDTVYAYSTNVARAKMSLAVVLAGLFPPPGNLKWHDGVDWMPVPFDYNFESFDFLWTAYYCDEFLSLWNATMRLPEVQSKLREHKDFINDLADKTDLPRDDPQIAISLRESVHSQSSMGLPYPGWCTDEVYEELSELSAFRFDVFAYTDAMKRLAAGPTLRRFLRNVGSSETGSKTKIYLYSAHDDNVATFVRTHGFAGLRRAEYGSGVVFEKLKARDGRIYVRFLYYPGDGEVLQTLKLDQCEEVCPLSKYLEIVQPVLPDGEGTECLYKRAYRDVENVINGLGTNKYSNSLHLMYTNEV